MACISFPSPFALPSPCQNRAYTWEYFQTQWLYMCAAWPSHFFHTENQITGFLINIPMGSMLKTVAICPPSFAPLGHGVVWNVHTHITSGYSVSPFTPLQICCSVDQKCPVAPTRLLWGWQKQVEVDCRNSGHWDKHILVERPWLY